MAIISFWSNCKKETGQTLSIMSIASSMAIEHNFKSIVIGTDFREKTLEYGFWPRGQGKSNVQNALGISDKPNSGNISGVEGLAMIVQSGRTGKDIIENYTKPVLRDNRLDVLLPTSSYESDEYLELCEKYPQIVKMANSDYNFVFVDINRKVPGPVQKEILEISDVIVVSLKQEQYGIEEFGNLRKSQPVLNKNNVMALLGRYDEGSKINIKNVERLLKLRDAVIAVPYNNLYFESVMDGKITDYFFKFINVKNPNDINAEFLQYNRTACDLITYKLKELQIR